jgi:hypothetical protein
MEIQLKNPFRFWRFEKNFALFNKPEGLIFYTLYNLNNSSQTFEELTKNTADFAPLNTTLSGSAIGY